MTIQDLGSLGELLGSIAVLVTLVYLALQTRQNTMAISAQLDGARIGSLLNLRLTMATSTELQEALAEDRVGEITISEERRTLCWRAQVAHFQWLFVQVERDLLPTVTIEGVRMGMLAQFSRYRSFNRHWEGQKPTLVPEFVAWVDEQRAKASRA